MRHGLIMHLYIRKCLNKNICLKKNVLTIPTGYDKQPFVVFQSLVLNYLIVMFLSFFYIYYDIYSTKVNKVNSVVINIS